MVHDDQYYYQQAAAKARHPSKSSAALLTEAINDCLYIIEETRPHSPLGNRQQIAEHLLDIIINGKAPSTHFTYLSNGCYKECYQLDDAGRYVVKFAIKQNPTEKEAELLQQAHFCDVGDFFAPTWFVNFFGFTVPCSCIDTEYFEDSRYVPDMDRVPYFTNLIIQPTIQLIEDPVWWNCCDAYCSDSDNFSVRDESNTPAYHIITHEQIPYEIASGLRINDKPFVEALCSQNSEAAIAALCRFIKQFDLCDLHPENIGYLRDEQGALRPVIFDWFSA